MDDILTYSLDNREVEYFKKFGIDVCVKGNTTYYSFMCVETSNKDVIQKIVRSIENGANFDVGIKPYAGYPLLLVEEENGTTYCINYRGEHEYGAYKDCVSDFV